MRRGKNKILPIVVTLFTLLLTLACYADKTKDPNCKGENCDIRYMITGQAIDTWSWGPGYYSCDTVDEMKLNIKYDGSALMRLSGACFVQPEGADKCTTFESNLPCGLVLMGTYDHEQERLTITDCNNADANNGSGEIVIKPGKDIETFTLQGSASCTFTNSNEQHTITFAP